MDFKSVSVNNCYILRNEVFNNRFFTYINAKAVYSASIFHLAFFKGDIKLLPKDIIKEYEQLIIRLYRVNSPYLYIPFEINFHEEKLYQSYYESDHFPLSLWLEEKNLIPFDIFIRIMEDVLLALQTLEKNGISHLFLTPEEILVPLQWTASNHVKLYNVGINLLVSSLMDDNEIHNYKKNYYKDNTKKSEDKLIFNISDDLYSFGKIMNQLASFCNFNDDKSKIKIQNILNTILSNSNNFNSIEEVISLFHDYFSENNRQNILPDKSSIPTYSGQASFIVPEFNEWHEEAELESLSEINYEGSNVSVKKIEKKSFYNSITAIFKRFFSRKLKKKSVSLTLNEYTESKKTASEKSNGTIMAPDKSDKNKPATFKEATNTNNLINNFEHTKSVLEKIRQHFTSTQFNNKVKTKKPVTKDSIDYNVESKREIIRNRPGSSNSKETLFGTDTDFYNNLNKSFEDRDYKRTYKIIQKSIDIHPKKEQKNQESKIKNLLDEKLKQLDNHYVKDIETTIPEQITKINKFHSMSISKNNNKVKGLNTSVDNKKINKKSQEFVNFKNPNFFIRFFYFIKNKIENIIK